MATVCEHLSVEELEERYVGCLDATASRHFQVIWLLARGHTFSQVSATTAFGERWIEQLLARYNAEGPEALGDLRRRNGASATILKPERLAKLGDRLRLNDTWADTTTAHGRLMLTVLGGLAEFERELIRERTGEGRARAVANGVRLGRKPTLTHHQQREAIKRLKAGKETQGEIARSYDVSRWTISRL
jgi:hypothetical protein